MNSNTNRLYLLVLSLLVSGCELIGTKVHEKLPIESVVQDEALDQAETVYQELSNEVTETLVDSQVQKELYLGSGQFTSSKPYYSGIQTSSKKGKYNLNFDAADLGEVAKVILSDGLGENYVLSPKVTGKVTLQTSRSLGKDELLSTLEMLLKINQAGMVYQDGLYQIKPVAELIGYSAFSANNRYQKTLPAGHQIRVIPVKNVAAKELAALLKPLMQEKVILHVDSNRNILLIAGTASELDRAMEMVRTFDIDVMKGRSFGLFPLQSVDAETIIKELEKVLNVKSGNAADGFFQFLEIERLNAILVITHHASSLHEVERWITRLDRSNTYSSGGVIVYRVQHVDAVELASTLNKIFNGQKKSRSASVASSKTVKITNKNQKKNKKPRLSSSRQLTSISDVSDVKIIADEINNALIVVATAQEYKHVQKIIKQLDVMPLQVLIDATIIEVTLKDELRYGIKWFLNHSNGGDNAANSGGINLIDSASRLATTVATGGFGYAFVSDSGAVKAVLDASATDNSANVISAPSIMVLNNHEATIQVGKEVPVLASESTNTGGGARNVVTNTIQMRETGITLTVKPRVNANGLVIMEIDQKADDVLEQEVSGIRSPSFQQRQIKSTVAVQSGETIVLGGLISENDTFNKSGIPLLHKIPLIGPLFGNTTKNQNKTELVVLLTPRVVKSRQDARLITNEFKRKLSGIYTDVIAPDVVQ